MLRKKEAPELEFSNAKQWINSDPLTLEKLRGKVVLLDFWTYSCVNCLRTLPALKEIWKKYKQKRFMLIGVHTPEFEFEKEIGNVKYAVKKHDISWPILQDPSHSNWDNYGNTYWPRAAVISSEGNIVLNHVGEAGYDEIESVIVGELTALREIFGDVEIKPETRPEYHGQLSKETYAGSLRSGGLGSAKVCTKEGCDQYADPDKHRPGVIYPHGDWAQEKEYVEYHGTQGEGWINYQFYAKEVNVVLGGAGKAEVLLNGKSITTKEAGKDIAFEDGKSFVSVQGGDMYNLISLSFIQGGTLTIKPFSEMKLYAYTFG